MGSNLLIRARARLLGVPEIRRPIIMTGTVRSGTTFLDQCLREHPDLAGAGFELSVEWSEGGRIPMAVLGTRDRNCPAMTAADLSRVDEKGLRFKLGRAMMFGGAHAGSRLLTKNPHLWNKLQLVHAIFPDAVLLIISRDLYSSVASTIRLWQWAHRDHGVCHYLPPEPTACWDMMPADQAKGLAPDRVFPGGDAAVIADYWLRVYQRVEADAPLFAVHRFIKHRDLLADPERFVREVYEAIDVPFAPLPKLEEVDASRNRNWPQILSASEQASLAAWVERRRAEVEALQWTDNELPPL